MDYLLAATDSPGFFMHFLPLIPLTNEYVIQILFFPSNLSSQNIQTYRCSKYAHYFSLQGYKKLGGKI